MEANKIATFSKTEEIRGAVFTEILCLHLSISAFSIIIVNRMILTPPPHSPHSFPYPFILWRLSYVATLVKILS